MRRYPDILTLTAKDSRQGEISIFLSNLLQNIKTLKRTNQVRKINSALMSLYFYRSDLRVQ